MSQAHEMRARFTQAQTPQPHHAHLELAAPRGHFRRTPCVSRLRRASAAESFRPLSRA